MSELIRRQSFHSGKCRIYRNVPIGGLRWIQNFLQQLNTRLSKVGIIEGRKGISGFRLLKPAREISLLEIYKSIMEVNQVHIFDIHQNPNDECIVGRNIKPTLEGMFNRMEKEMEEKLAGMSLEDCVNAMRKELKEKE